MQHTLQEAGVKTVSIPGVGKVSGQRQAVERSRQFRRAYRWRAGIEGRINRLRRDYGLRRRDAPEGHPLTCHGKAQRMAFAMLYPRVWRGKPACEVRWAERFRAE
jgi:IS5 family transposase